MSVAEGEFYDDRLGGDCNVRKKNISQQNSCGRILADVTLRQIHSPTGFAFSDAKASLWGLRSFSTGRCVSPGGDGHGASSSALLPLLRVPASPLANPESSDLRKAVLSMPSTGSARSRNV